MPQLPESSQPWLTSWVARVLLSGYFVAITKQHFFGKPIFKTNSPNLPRVGFHFLWRVQGGYMLHLHFISDTLMIHLHYGHGVFSWPIILTCWLYFRRGNVWTLPRPGRLIDGTVDDMSVLGGHRGSYRIAAGPLPADANPTDCQYEAWWSTMKPI